MSNEPVFHVCSRDAWRQAHADGVYAGSPQDRADGFIHLSAADQVAAVLALFFDGQSDLLLLTIDAEALGDALHWEEVPGHGVFPHLYDRLPVPAVQRVDGLPLGPDGRHLLPAHLSGDDR